MNRIIYIAGKNDIACNALDFLVNEFGYPKKNIKVICVSSDNGESTWQKSLRRTAEKNCVEIVPIHAAYDDSTALFISLEYDQIIRTSKFKTKSLYNIHFSKLPSYRGIGMAVWPLINGEKESGVTLHEIDDGIDTGRIIHQKTFQVPLTWTSRDLYQAFLDNGSILFKECISGLITGSYNAISQDIIDASYFSRLELDYSNIEINFNKTAYQVHNQIRAFIFPEYQLPVVCGRKVIKSEILNIRSTKKPGLLVRKDTSSACISTVDYDVRIVFAE
jgi:methionyl-tRNA formyltransferase